MMQNRIEKAVNWAETHWEETFSSGDLAGVACLSEYHFRRMFTAMTGIGPGMYIKRRRLSLAAKILTQTDNRIIDIAFQSGFESQEAFTRAFKAMFHITPAECRTLKPDLSRLVQPVMDQAYFNHLQEGIITMTPAYKTRERFCVAGLGRDYTAENKQDIPQLWDRFMQRRHEISATGIIDYGVCSKANNEDSCFHYTASTAIHENEPLPKGMERIVIPANTYAVFTHKGHLSQFEKTIEFIWKVWLPKSGKTLADAPDFEVYDGRFNPETMSGEIEIWVPVKD